MQRYIKEGNDFMSMENEFVKMNILTQTKPGVPNVNGYTYSQEVYDNIVTRIQDHHRFIPIIKEPRQGFCFNKDTASINISILVSILSMVGGAQKVVIPYSANMGRISAASKRSKS